MGSGYLNQYRVNSIERFLEWSEKITNRVRIWALLTFTSSAIKQLSRPLYLSHSVISNATFLHTRFIVLGCFFFRKFLAYVEFSAKYSLPKVMFKVTCAFGFLGTRNFSRIITENMHHSCVICRCIPLTTAIYKKHNLLGRQFFWSGSFFPHISRMSKTLTMHEWKYKTREFVERLEPNGLCHEIITHLF